MRFAPLSLVDATLGLVAILGIAVALWNLHAGQDGVTMTSMRIGETPATIFRPTGKPAGPAVVIAHGFAGSQQLMRPFALTLARNGYVAVTFDFPGHGRNPLPLGGDITVVEGATRVLVDALARVADVARGLGDGRLAVLGHSMASDIVVRFAQATPDVSATVAVSMFSPAVTKDTPGNLLIIVGNLEGFLKSEALRVVSLAAPDGGAEAGVTYGDLATGTGRRAAFSAGVEHIGVLYSEASMAEALTWLNGAFARTQLSQSRLDRSGPMILLLLGAIVALARPLSRLAPRLDEPSTGAGL